jgi:2-hydroxycyclohexanecarboxyl-CoA dehydrogenase
VVEEANALGGGGRTVLIKTDVTDWNSVQSMVKKALEAFGQIDVLVNNVGWTSRDEPFWEQAKEEWEKEIGLVMWGGMYCTKAVVPHMIGRKQGTIVNISSDAGRAGQPGQTVYSGTKGAVIAMTKALAKEVGRYGITVNAVCPGLIVPEELEHVGNMSVWTKWGWGLYGKPAVQEAVLKAAPVKRLGRAHDVADMVVFLASHRASYITGQTVSINGGMVMM